MCSALLGAIAFLWNIVHLRRARCESVVTLWMSQRDTPIHYWLYKNNLQLELLWGLSDFIDKQGGQRRGLVDKAVEVVAAGVWGVYRTDWGGSHLVWDVIASRRRRTVTADLVVKPVSNQIRSVEGFSAGLNRCCVGTEEKIAIKTQLYLPMTGAKVVRHKNRGKVKSWQSRST